MATNNLIAIKRKKERFYFFYQVPNKEQQAQKMTAKNMIMVDRQRGI